MKRTIALVAAGTMVLAACGSDGGDSATPVPQPSEESSAADGAAAPTNEVPLASGGTVDLAAFAGQDVLFWFWAPW